MQAAQPITSELGLRYLLELSTDIRLALLLDRQGELIAAAPERPSEHVAGLAGQLMREAGALGGSAATSGSVELDAIAERGAVFLIEDDGTALLCVTGRLALPGLILHDMRAVLDDLRAARAGDR
jgi:hypothetical protein